MAKKIGVVLLVLVVCAALVLGWMWRRVTALPDWYVGGDAVAQPDQTWVVVPEAERPAGAPADAPVHVVRNAHLNVVEGTKGAKGATGSVKGTPVERAIKQSRMTYAGGHLEAGAVLNMQDADLSKLSAAEREEFQKVVDAFPALTGRDVYVGVEGAVTEHDGEIELGPDAKLRVGNTRYNLANAAKRLGISEQELRRSIEQELSRHSDGLPK